MKVSDAAAAYASRFGVDLEALTDQEARALDVGDSGEVTEADAKAVIRLFHGGFEGPLTADERQRLKAFADGDLRWSGAAFQADFLHRHLADRADEFETQANHANGDAWSGYAAARSAAPAADPATTDELRARLVHVRAALAAAPQKQAAFTAASRNLSVASGQLASAQDALARAQSQLRALHASVGQDTPEALQSLITLREEQCPDEKVTLVRLRGRLADATAARGLGQQVTALQREVAQAQKSLAAVRAPLPPQPADVATLQTQRETLERQLALRETAGLYTGTQAQWRVAHGLSQRAHEVRVVPVNDALRKGFGALVSAERDSTEHEDLAQRLAKVMAGPVALQALIDAGKLKRGDVQTEFLGRQLDQMQAMMAAHTDALDRDARAMADELSDPVFQEAMQREPETVRADVVSRMVAVLSKSQEGKAYFERDIRPALEGKPGASAFWRGLLVADKTEKGAQTSTKVTFKVLGALGGLIASQKDASKLLDSSLKTALGLSGDKGVAELQAAVLEFKGLKDELGDKPTPAQLAQAKEKFRVAMQGTPLARLANSIDTVSDTLTALGGAISVAEAFRDPSIKSTLEAIRGTADMGQAGANFASRIVAQGGRWATFSKAAGSLGSVASGVLADMDRRSAEQRGDIGGTVGASFSETGSAVAATGLALDATGIGAAIGLPLNAIGGGLSAAGTAISFFFKDSDSTQWLRDNDLMMYSSHSSYASQHD